MVAFNIYAGENRYVDVDGANFSQIKSMNEARLNLIHKKN